VGRYLARQRRLRGISLDDLADLTKIPRRSLERLESGAFDHQTDGFVRSFVRAVAGALGLDCDDAVLRLLCEPPEDDAEGAARAGLSRRRLLAFVWIALGLGAAVLVLRRLGAVSGGGVGETPELVTRRDAVRDLAEREAARARRPPP
jgi:cytoskeletal protein RodZ